MSHTRDLSKLAAILDTGTAGQVLTSQSGSNFSFADAAAGGIAVAGTLTKTFTQNEESTITLSSAVSPVPNVSVFKEVPQAGIISKGNWDVDATSSNYLRLDEAISTTITPSAVGSGTFSLGSGAFASSDIGKTITGNGGVAVLTSAAGAYTSSTNFTNTNQIASGSWNMHGSIPESDGSGLTLSVGPDIGYSLPSKVISTTNKKAITSANFGVDFAVNMDCDISPDGDFVYFYKSNYIYQTALTTPFDLTSTGTKSTFSPGFYIGPFGFSFNSDGTAWYAVGRLGGGQARHFKKWTLSTAYDLSTATAGTYATLGTTHIKAITISEDETFALSTGTNDREIVKHTFNGAGDISSVTTGTSLSFNTTYGVPEITSGSYTLSVGGMKLMDGGTRLLIKNYNYHGDYYLVDLTTANDITAGTYTSTSGDIGTVMAYSGNFGVKIDGSKVYHILASSSSAGEIVEISIGQAGSPPTSQYFPSVTAASGQIDTSAWTDVNSMTADETAGNGTLSYAISTDNHVTWKVIHNTDGTRSIAKNNSGTWQINTHATYASETWANATTNTELAALQQALATANNRMNKTQLDAVADANHITLADTLDLMIAPYIASGTTAPISDGVTINYDGAALVQQAVNGTDYEAEFPSSTSVKIKSLAAQNLKVRVL